MHEGLKKLYEAVTPGTEVMLYMARIAAGEPAVQLVLRRGKKRVKRVWMLEVLSMLEAPPASAAGMMAEAARDMDEALQRMEQEEDDA